MDSCLDEWRGLTDASRICILNPLLKNRAWEFEETPRATGAQKRRYRMKKGFESSSSPIQNEWRSFEKWRTVAAKEIRILHIRNLIRLKFWCKRICRVFNYFIVTIFYHISEKKNTHHLSLSVERGSRPPNNNFQKNIIIVFIYIIILICSISCPLTLSIYFQNF